MVFFLCRCPLRITVSQQRCADSSAAMSGLDSAGEARQEGPGGVGAALQGWTLRGVSNSWLPSLNNTERTALRPELSRGRDFAWTQRSQDIYLDAECAQASFKLRQPHDTHTNDDGVQVLPPSAPIAQSVSQQRCADSALRTQRGCETSISSDGECAQASLKLRQPHDTRTNDDGVLPLPVPIAQSQ